MSIRHTSWLPLLILSACTQPGPDEDGPSVSPPASPDDDLDRETEDWPELPELDAEIEAIMSDSRIPGLSACIISEAEVAWCGAYGWAQIDDEVAVETDTPFMLASISKLITATALMQLWEDGHFQLDEPVSDALDFPLTHPSDATPITYRQLLSHVGGVRDNWDVMESLYVDGDSPIALGDFLADYFDPEGLYYHESRNWVPDGVQQEMVYSNMGFALIGHLVEQLSGRDFADYCTDEIFTPLGMTQTAWHLADLDESEVAMPYLWVDAQHQAVGHYGYPDYPNGGLRASAESLARFMAMAVAGGELDDIRIVEEDTMLEMWTSHYPDLDDSQGLSWYSWRLQGTEIWGHSGGDIGVATQAGIRWSDGLGFVFLMNASGTRGDTFESLEQALFTAGSDL